MTEQYAITSGRVTSRGKPLWTKAGEPVEGIDAETFEVLGERFFRDKNRVYVQGQQGSGTAHIYFYAIDDADPDTFRVLNLRYAKDARQAYYVTGVSIRTTSAHMVRVVRYLIRTIYGDLSDCTDNSKFAVDQEFVYSAGKRLKDADPKTFAQIGGDYFGDKNRIWYQNQLMKDVDRASFIYVGEEVMQSAAADKYRSYRHGDPVPNSTARKDWAAYFQARPSLKDYWWYTELPPAATGISVRDLGDGYSTDGRRIYMKGISLDDLDPASFQNLGNSFARDKKGLYSYASYHEGFLDGGKLEGGDPDTLESIGFGYFKDKQNAYRLHPYGYAQAFKADTGSLTALSEAYAKDENAVYHHTTRKKGIDPKTAAALNELYLKDDQAVYFRGKAIKGPFDPATAETLHAFFIRDAQGHLFFEGRPVSRAVDARSLVFLGDHFARDSKAAYFVSVFGLKSIGADVQSFTVKPDGQGQDKDRYYDPRELAEQYNAYG